MKQVTVLFLFLFLTSARAADSKSADAPAPRTDRVGFPQDYVQIFEILRVVNKTNEQKVVTIYGNKQAASVTNSAQLPYPYGSVIVMETAIAGKDSEGKVALAANGNLHKDKVTGLHVMRREKGFGEAYGKVAPENGNMSNIVPMAAT
jgi:hypothetical protein